MRLLAGGDIAARSPPVDRLRRLIVTRRPIAVLVIALFLAMKTLSPAGFMPRVSNGQIVIGVCSDAEPAQMVMAPPDAAHGGADHDDGGKPEPACPYSGLASPALSVAGPTLLSSAMLFVMTMVERMLVPPRHTRRLFLRPPLRAPPAAA